MTPALLAWLLAAGAPVAAPLPPAEQLKQARSTFDYGNYGAAAEQLEQLTVARTLERAQDQIEAFRLLGLSQLFLRRPEASRRAFLNLLSLDPDFQLDALYVPPQAVTFFDKVRTDNQSLLEPIRERKRATQAAIADEEQARQRLLAPLATPPLPPSVVVRERIDRPSPLIALLPGGAGQFQNGEVALGVTFAVLQALTLGASIGCWAWVESQRGADGNYSASVYGTAITLRNVQLATGVGFGALWATGAVESVLRLRPPTTVVEEAPTSSAKSSAPALGAGLAPVKGGAIGSLDLTF